MVVAGGQDEIELLGLPRQGCARRLIPHVSALDGGQDAVDIPPETRALPDARFHPRGTGREKAHLRLRRPPYQRNDYIGWITRAKLPATRQKRLEQMLDELEKGDAYMKMVFRAKGV